MKDEESPFSSSFILHPSSFKAGRLTFGHLSGESHPAAHLHGPVTAVIVHVHHGRSSIHAAPERREEHLFAPLW
jgi:hypothetical protein